MKFRFPVLLTRIARIAKTVRIRRIARWFGWAGLGAIALLLFHTLFVPMFFAPMFSATSATNLPNPNITSAAAIETTTLDARIQSLRMGEFKVHIVDPAGRPLPSVQVHLKQTRHSFPFGGSLRTELFQEGNERENGDRQRALDLAATLFNATVPEDALKWYSTEPVAGQVSYDDADRILQWSEQRHLPMRGHHLFWEVEQWNQPWLKALAPEVLRTAVQQRATQVCQRYRGRIAEYDVLNEILNGDFFQGRLGAGIIKDMFLWCHRADPTAQLFTNEYNILNGEQLDRYIELVRSLLAEGVPLGGIGVQAHIRQTISADQMQSALDRLAVFGLPIKLTEVSVVANTEVEQAQMLGDLYRVAFAHPAVTGIMMWGFWQGANWEPRSAIFRQNFEPTAAALAYQNLVFQQWWSDETGSTDPQGEWSTRTFFGDYDITVTDNGRSMTQSVQFYPGQARQDIIFQGV